MTATAYEPLLLGVPVPLKNVERELAGQLRGATQDQAGAPAQRVRMSNLLIFTDSVERARKLSQQAPDVILVHPARVQLLVCDPAATGHEIIASVSVQCHRLSVKQQGCAEIVVLQAPPSLAERLPFAVRSLLIGDLPINLLWSATTPPPMAGHLLYELGERAQQIMYDSLDWPDPARGVAATASWIEQTERAEAGRWRVVSDLNWRRLKYWRRIVSQSLDPTSAAGAADSITEVLVEHGPSAAVQGWELASWVASRMGWRLLSCNVQPGVEMTWRFYSSAGDVKVRVKRLPEGPPSVTRVRIACTLDGKPVAMNLTEDGPYRLAVKLEGEDAAPRTVTVPPLTPAELIGRQLSDRERDPVFRDSMAVAQQMARGILK
jgi:glucose-6-phosphate dehydrogenase assembly protein OpcA